MKTIRRLIYREVLLSIAVVTLGFLGLFFFFDVVDELQAVGRYGAQGYTLSAALLYVTLLIPSHLYELLPIVVLIGTIFVMARFAQSSEYTILRTSGLGPWRALRTLLVLGMGFVVLTFACGDYLAPWSDRYAQLLKSRFQGNITTGQTGAWLKERQQDNSYAVNIASIAPNGDLLGLKIFEFDAKGALLTQTLAPKASFGPDGAWLLENADRRDFAVAPLSATPSDIPSIMPSALPQATVAPQTRAQIGRSVVPSFRWPTEITAEMVSVALLKPERMATLDLFRYMRHLNDNGQSAQRYEIEFWKKVFYPLACLVMVVLALPFAYLHFRTSGITTYVFGGVMVGISFFLANNVLGHIGTLRHWQPWLTAAAPGMIYSLVSLAAFTWLVLRR
jgi:lipopolysaccharide export system permease protein